MQDFSKIYFFIYGALTIIGGLIGYLKAGSKASIIAGGISGLLLLLAGYLVTSGKIQPGFILGLVIAIALAGRFAPGFFSSYKFMPAGMMTILSLIAAGMPSKSSLTILSITNSDIPISRTARQIGMN